MLLRELVLSRYDCNPSLTTDKIIVIVIYSSFVEQGKEWAINNSLHGFGRRFDIQYEIGMSSSSPLIGIFIDDMDDL